MRTRGLVLYEHDLPLLTFRHLWVVVGFEDTRVTVSLTPQLYLWRGWGIVVVLRIS
jgi:hypothetical protein